MPHSARDFKEMHKNVTHEQMAVKENLKRDNKNEKIEKLFQKYSFEKKSKPETKININEE